MARANRCGLILISLVLWGLGNAQGGNGGDGGDAVASNINIVHSKIDNKVSGGDGGDGATTGSENSTAGDGGHGGNAKVTNKNTENSKIANRVSGGDGGEGRQAVTSPGNQTGGRGGNVAVTNSDIRKSTIDNIVTGGKGGDSTVSPEEVVGACRSEIKLRLAEIIEVEVRKAEFEMERQVQLSWDRWMRQWRRWMQTLQQNRELDQLQWERSRSRGYRNSTHSDVGNNLNIQNASFGRPSCKCGANGSGDSFNIWGNQNQNNKNFCCCNSRGCGPECIYGTWCRQ